MPERQAVRVEPVPEPGEGRRVNLIVLVVALVMLAGLEYLGSRPRRAFVPPSVQQPPAGAAPP